MGALLTQGLVNDEVAERTERRIMAREAMTMAERSRRRRGESGWMGQVVVEACKQDVGLMRKV